MVFWDGNPGREWRLEKVLSIGPSCSFALSLQAHRKKLCESCAKAPSATQAQSSHQKPTLPKSEYQTISLQKRGKINFCCLNHSVYGILLWPLKQINRGYFSQNKNCNALKPVFHGRVHGNGVPSYSQFLKENPKAKKEANDKLIISIFKILAAASCRRIMLSHLFDVRLGLVTNSGK